MHTYQALQKKLKLSKTLPISPDWSAAADFLDIIYTHCIENKPKIIVECSSGTSTLVLAKSCQSNKKGKVTSLENGQEYAHKTQHNLKKFSLERYVDVIYAPLETRVINQQSYQWYQDKRLPETLIDMLVIDGPPGFIQKHSRYPALPILYDRLADKSVVFLDDAARDEEKEIVNLWLEEYPEMEHKYIDTERGCSVLVINKS